MKPRLCHLFTALLAAGCLGDAEPDAPEPPGTPSRSAIAVAAVPDEPPPISQEARLIRAPARAPEDPLRFFRAAAELRGKSRILAVRARVESVTPQEKRLPEPVAWGDDLPFATAVALTVVEPVCGPAAPTKLTAWYAGGILPDGRGFHTSAMTKAPEVGNEYVFWLEQLDGDWFLTHETFLLRRSGDRFLARQGAQLTTADVKGVCP